MGNVMIIAAHPDDEILGCGGLIKKYSKDDDFYVLILTAGAETRYEKEMEEELRNNAIEANKIVGTKEIIFENLPNQGMDSIPITKIIKTIEKYIDKYKPDAVYVNHGGDLNKDHVIAYEAAITATRPVLGQCVKKIISYNTISSTEWNFIEGEKLFVPNMFLNIKHEIDSKIKAMMCYPSECRPYPHPRSPEAIKAIAHYWGITVGLEYAEVFKIIRHIEP